MRRIDILVLREPNRRTSSVRVGLVLICAALSFDSLIVPAAVCAADLEVSAPIEIRGAAGVAIVGKSIANPDGPCVRIVDGSTDIRIENSEIGPCRGSGIEIHSSTSVSISGSHVHDTQGNAVDIYNSSGIRVSDNRLERSASAVYALESSGIVVEHNQFRNVLGPGPRGQFVQFNKVYGGSNRIRCNAGVNEPGASSPEDAISIYMSRGLPADPIEVEANRIVGGGPSESGGGIMLGDAGGAYIRAANNILVDPGQYGIAVAGGEHIQVEGNLVRGRKQPFTNVGIYVWNQSSGSCRNVKVSRNRVDWTNRNDARNSFWSGGNCTDLDVSSDNRWGDAIDRENLDALPEVCQAGSAMRQRTAPRHLVNRTKRGGS